MQQATGAHISYINLSGGVGIPYRPEPVSYTHLLAEFYEQLQAPEAAAAHNDEGVVRQLAAMIPTLTRTRENLKL